MSAGPKHAQPGSLLTLHYRLAGPDGRDVISTFGGRPATLTLGSGQLAPPLEARLLGMAEGARACFELASGEAFGERNDRLLQRVPRALLATLGLGDRDYRLGDVLQLPAPDHRGSFSGVVREIGDEGLLCDFNHPLAGCAVSFEVDLIDVM